MSAIFVAIIVSGVLYSLQAVAFVVIYRATGVINFAAGFLLELGAYIAYSLIGALGGDFWLATVLTVIAVACIGALLYRLVLVHMEGAPLWASVMALFGIGYIIEAYIGLQWNAEQVYLLPPISTRLLTIGLGMRITVEYLVITIAGVVLLAATLLVIRYTSIGIKMRATGENKILAAYGGINVGRISTFAWLLGGALIGFSGIANGLESSISPDLASTFLAVFPAIIFGGLESFAGAIVGSFVLVAVITYGTFYISPDIALPLSYSVLLLVLLVRPSGLFGAKDIVRI